MFGGQQGNGRDLSGEDGFIVIIPDDKGSPRYTSSSLSTSLFSFFMSHYLFVFFCIIIIFLTEGKGQKYGCERETLIGCLSHMLGPGREPIAWVCALTGNRTHDLLVYGMTLQPTEPHQPGPCLIILLL